MTVKVSKPAINVREELADLKKPTGIAGQAMLAAETPQEQFNLIGAGRRNLIINGGMVFSQRNGTSAVTLNSAGSVIYDFDRWRRQVYENGKLSLQQVTDAPSGFSYSIKATTASAVSPSGAGYYMFNQPIEGFNTAHLAFGTSSAKTITLSFWVKSTLTGQWSGAIKNGASNRAYVFTYQINSANAWEYKTITIAGDTSGTWVGSTNGVGLSLMYDLGTDRSDLQGTSNAWSSTNAYAASTGVRLVQNASATWQITGVQLEVGKVATPFEHRSYGEELALCQRYYTKWTIPTQWTGYQNAATKVDFNVYTPVPLRNSTPSLQCVGSFYKWSHEGYQVLTSPSILIAGTGQNQFSNNSILCTVDGFSGGDNGYVANVYIANLEIDDEL
jgi:hypothetical protein